METKKYKSKQDKSKIVKNEASTDFFYQLRESVMRITGYSIPDENGEYQEAVFSLCDKLVYSIMLHRYSAFLAENKDSKPIHTIYYDNQIDIASRIGIDRKTVERSIKKLCDIGVVQKFFKTTNSGGARKSASYVVKDLFCVENVNWFCDCADVEGKDCVVTRTFLRKEEKKLAVQPKPVVQEKKYTPAPKPVYNDFDEEENCPF